MFFLLSKILIYLVMPITMVIILLVASWLIKNERWKKRLRISGIVLLLFFCNEFIANEVMLAWEIKPTAYEHMRPHALGIVLTGATLPLKDPDDRVYFQRGADRVTHTVQLYKLGLIKKILVSGGSGRLMVDYEPEASLFKKSMVMMGVDSADILVEKETRNTYESAVAVRPMLDSLGYRAEDCLLITSSFHMRRSLACYKKAGVILEPFACDFYAHPRSFYPDAFLIPKIEALRIWHILFKEWVGMIMYKLAGYI